MMNKVLIFGNSASGKSTLALKLASQYKLAHLDLDTLAWQVSKPPTRKPLSESAKDISEFIQAHQGWVIEGCYTDLLTFAETEAGNIIFIDLAIEDCIANANSRPWEPHKYSSKAAQDENLGMLIEWISHYEQRQDTFSKNSHLEFYRQYQGKKTRITSNQEVVYLW
jgi:adenylate kinase family enzyme